MKSTAGCIAALAVVLLLSSCASFPRPQSDRDTLLLIPASIVKKDSFPVFGHYQVHVVGDQVDTVVDIPPYGGYGLVQGLPPGRYSITEAVFRYDWDKVGSTITPSVHFEIAPGEVTVVNTRFVTEIDNSDTGGVMRGWFVAPAKAEMDAWISRLGQDKDVRTWGQDHIRLDGTTDSTGMVGADEKASPDRFFIHTMM